MDFQPILPEELGMDNMGGMRNRIVIIPASFCKVVPKSTLIKNAENSNDLTVSKSVTVLRGWGNGVSPTDWSMRIGSVRILM